MGKKEKYQPKKNNIQNKAQNLNELDVCDE